MDNLKPFILTSPDGQSWMVRIYHENGERCMYTSKTDEPGERYIKVKSFDGYFKIKISNEGRIITYPWDSLG